MDAHTIEEIIKLGSAGAVIIVVIVFLNFISKRDTEWREFFKTLNASANDDMRKIASTLDKLILAVDCINRDLQNHDRQVEDRIRRAEDNGERRVKRDGAG